MQFIVWWLARLALAFFICGAVAHAATCAEGQLPYAAGAYSGSTAVAACQAWAAGVGVEFTGTESRNNNGTAETWCNGDSLFRGGVDSYQLVTSVCEVAATPPDGGASSPDGGTGGTTVNGTVQVVLPTVTAEDYEAVLVVVGAGVAALVFLWAMGAFIRLFDSSPDA